MPNAQLTTDEVRVIYFTRGLPAQVDWGATCPTQIKDDPQVALGKKALKEALTRLGNQAVLLRGNLQKGQVQVNQYQPAPFPIVEIDLFTTPDQILSKSKSGVIDLKPPAEIQNQSPQFTFLPQINIPKGGDPNLKPLSWTLWVARVGQPLQPVKSGKDTPPKTVIWSGVDLMGTQLIERGVIYRYQFEVQYASFTLV